VTERLLVWPVSVGQRAHPQRIRDRVVPTLLRLAAAISRTIFRGRGVGLACTVAAQLVGSRGQTSFQLGNGGSFLVTVDDKYWLQPLLLDRSYELDLDNFLRRTLTSRDVFLDCGANLGLWSIAAAGVIRDSERVVAVEASSRTFARLIANWEANDRSFTVLHCALSDVTGSKVSFFASAGDHASATLVEGLSPDDAQPEIITTVSLLDLVRERMSSDAGDALVFVKLDIEGMERQVLATIDPEQHGELVIMYEDHGSNTTHITPFLLERGFGVAFMADDGALEQIRRTALHRLDALKVNPARGYNLLAVAKRGAAASRLARLYPQLELGPT
jgi:FkbM family methyltransferase